MAAGPDQPPLRTLIMGSCVARDTFEYLAKGRFSLTLYRARQSLISSFTPPVTVVKPAAMKSPFQRRLAQADYDSSLPTDLERTADTLDLILWDLADERLGVYCFPDGTCVTRTVDMIAARGEDPVRAQAKLIRFGTNDHFARWSEALTRFHTALVTHHSSARLVLFAVPWAERTVSGAPTPLSFGTSAALANQLYPRYLEAARGQGIEPVGQDIVKPAGSDTHKWGAAPFHYTDSVYEALIRAAELDSMGDPIR
ncbi:MAG: DUF6270 domain-containing protein [Propioniciclava sp.]